jgi:hypothetical protein
MLFVSGILLALFYLIDDRLEPRIEREARPIPRYIEIDGPYNVLSHGDRADRARSA